MLLIVNKEEAAFWLLDVIVGNLLPGMKLKPLLYSGTAVSCNLRQLKNLEKLE